MIHEKNEGSAAVVEQQLITADIDVSFEHRSKIHMVNVSNTLNNIIL